MSVLAVAAREPVAAGRRRTRSRCRSRRRCGRCPCRRRGRRRRPGRRSRSSPPLPLDLVLAGAAGEDVVVGAADRRDAVVRWRGWSGTCRRRVMMSSPRAAVDDVAAAEGDDRVVARRGASMRSAPDGPEQRVVTCRAGDRRGERDGGAGQDDQCGGRRRRRACSYAFQPLQTVRQRAAEASARLARSHAGRSCPDQPAQLLVRATGFIGRSVTHRPTARGGDRALADARRARAAADVTRKKSMWGPAAVDGVSQFPIYAELGVGIWQTSLELGRGRARGARRVRPTRPIPPTPGRRSSTRRSPTPARTASRCRCSSWARRAWANGGRRAALGADRPARLRRLPDRREPPLPAGAALDDLGRADEGVELPAAAPRPRTAAARARAARPRTLRADARSRVRRAQGASSRRNLVIGGNTFTVGTVSPLRWIQALRLPDGRPPRMDLYGPQPVLRAPPACSRRRRSAAATPTSATSTRSRAGSTATAGAARAAAGCGCSCRRSASRPTMRTSSSTSS